MSELTHQTVLVSFVSIFSISNFSTINGSIGLGLLVMAGAYFICGVIPLLFIKDRLFNPQKAEWQFDLSRQFKDEKGQAKW